jgi:hypothetical protein
VAQRMKLQRRRQSDVPLRARPAPKQGRKPRASSPRPLLPRDPGVTPATRGELGPYRSRTYPYRNRAPAGANLQAALQFGFATSPSTSANN